jgi:predicted DNA-binding antitoxin AbrB/MazE fold protein
MMTASIHAIYENGHLTLLTPVQLAEGQHVKIAIEPIEEKQSLLAALGDLVAHYPDTTDDSDAYLEDLANDIDNAFQGNPPLSQIIIEERGAS